MAMLSVWFLDVGHGDAAFIEMPNGARMMIDCGCGADHWPSTLLKYYRVGPDNPAAIPYAARRYGLDNLVITHPHGDHITDLRSIRDDVGFHSLTGAYGSIVNRLTADDIDFRRRGHDAAEVFFEVVQTYSGKYDVRSDRVHAGRPLCVVDRRRFLDYRDGMDLNELSWLVSLSIGGQKVLFTGDMTAAGVRRILDSDKAAAFADFVLGTTILKVPHHGRSNGCSEELFAYFGREPLACVVSDEVLNERNEGTSAVDWYYSRTSEAPLLVDSRLASRRVFTTRRDGDIRLVIDDRGAIQFFTHVFDDVRRVVYDRL